MPLFRLLACLILAIILPWGRAQAQQPWLDCNSSNWGDSQVYLNGNGLVPGVSWDAWRSLLKQSWSEADRTGPPWFKAESAIKAVSVAPLDTVYPGLDKPYYDTSWLGEPYVPAVPATPEQKNAYTAAAALYRARATRTKDWAAVAASFDDIAAGSSPYAAAAAYSAARATLYAGAFDDGFRRIERLVTDPAMREMHQAGYHLLGTIAAETGGAPLIAARLLQISHLIMAPPELRCRYGDLGGLSKQASNDLLYMLSLAYPRDHLLLVEPWSEHTQDVLARVSAIDPVIDLARVLAASRPFMNGFWVDPFFPDQVRYPGVWLSEQDTALIADPDSAAVTAYARRQAAATGNPLWTYALAQRTADAADLPAIDAVLQEIPALPIAPPDRLALQADLSSQKARILLMAGRLDDAIQVARGIAKTYQPAYRPGGTLRQDGTRYLTARRDLDGARKWNIALRQRYDPPEESDAGLAAPIATTWPELLAPGMGPKPLVANLPDPEASALDLLPADRIIALARTPGLSPGWRRPMLAAAWTRLYLLRRDADFRALFPDVRASFPELVSDLDEIDHAWLPSTRQHLITRMLLRLPGLSPRVLWVRPDRTTSQYQIQYGMAAIDPSNPSDGNWWCAVNPDRSARDAFLALFGRPLSQDVEGAKTEFGTFEWWGTPPRPVSVDAIAHDWLAWHPLLREADFNELQQLSKVESGPRRLAEQAVDWARHANWFTRLTGMDRDLPETLALAVRATRFGCRQQGPLGDVSRAAWTALHAQFPDSEWAKRTPYWFNEGKS